MLSFLSFLIEDETTSAFALKIHDTKSKSLFFFEKENAHWAYFFSGVAINTFGFLFFSLQRLPERSRPPTDPKMPFPYWKIDYFVEEMLFLSTIHLRIRQNQQKSGGGWLGTLPKVHRRYTEGTPNVKRW